MASILRRLSRSLSTSGEGGDSSQELSDNRRPSVSANEGGRLLGARDYQRAINPEETASRRASVASLLNESMQPQLSSSPSKSGSRILGARDYQLATDPQEPEARRASVASTLVEMSQPQPGSSPTKDSNRVFGSRDYKLQMQKQQEMTAA